MMKKNDCYLIGFLLFAALFSFYLLHINQKKGSYIEIQVQGNVAGIYSLEKDQIIDLKTNRIRISNGKAYIEAADCPDKLCIRQGAICRKGEAIVCLPHQIVVEVKEDNKDTEIDAYTY